MSNLSDILRARGLSQNQMAALLSVDKATVSRWVRLGVPAERVISVEAQTGIPREELRPDLYRRDNEAA